ncbi:hypothetical protein Glove_362g23 [Diversispora epigaea]|uniref:F-box domain-containing protein n=1 Tax=Diversispora epigaea TaxID=1348612 RepID=A0A397HDI4_9GLOM|nr:hypothetical protein Glove_362g23 [Diversispora epigaea]
MIIPLLPDDCIHEIFQYLQNDRTTLYQCLFVNKFWCGYVVPLLWKQPFSNFRCWEFIIRTYLDCLQPQELLNLKPFNLSIPNSSLPPLFQYERYLESFSNSDMEIGIISWLRTNEVVSFNNNNNSNNKMVSLNDERIRPIMRSLWQMFLSRSKNLRHLTINTGFGTSDLPEISLFQEIESSSSSYPRLSKLKSLDCCIGHKSHEIQNYKNTMNFLQNWGMICKSLKRIWVSVYEENIAAQDLISNIIESQKYLSEFKFTGAGNITENVITSLKYNSQFLITLKFWMLRLDGVSFEGLSSLKTLESLDIQWCEGITIKQCKFLSEAKFKLKSLSLWENTLSPEITSILIEKAGDTLLDLKFDIITMETIESASKYCPNIINLCTITKKESYDYLFPWIKKLKLKKLDFYSSGIDLSEGIRLLGENISPTLTYLNFDYISCTPESFEYFLKLCKAPLTTLVIVFSKEFIDNCLERIKDFVVERKSMRNLVFVCTPILWLKWSKRELEIIKIMEKYGLKVVKSISPPLTTLVIVFSKEFIDNCLERIKDFVVERKSMRNLVFVCTPILWLKWSKRELEIIKIMEKYGLKVVKSISRKF